VADLKFSSANGRKPQTEARRYVYAILVPMLEHELSGEACDGWMFGGIEEEPDKWRLTKAIRAVMVEMRRKADAP
jgi:hypothetical protein